MPNVSASNEEHVSILVLLDVCKEHVTIPVLGAK